MEDNIEVVPSAESGNVPVDAPSEQLKEAAPAVVEPEKPTDPVVETFELPDGRKVDGQTLAKEWKENFLPEFTRKSQTLAELEKDKTINPPTEKPYEKPDWQPQTWNEAIQIAKQEALQEIYQKELAVIEQHKAIEDMAVAQMSAVKAIDPNVNEDALFAHATKYGFKDLKFAHQNMKDMSEMAKKVQTKTAADIAKRNDPVSITPGATGIKSNPANFGSAIDYLRSLKT